MTKVYGYKFKCTYLSEAIAISIKLLINFVVFQLKVESGKTRL